MLKYARARECIQYIKYKEYITHNNEQNVNLIKKLLQSEGNHLLVASAGGGKTYGIIEIIKDLVKDDLNTVYVIACPNRIQNLQNHKSYKVFALVGGTSIDYGTLIVSAVYNKAEEIVRTMKELDKEVVLIVDEAHQLIGSYGYRKDALKSLEVLEEYSKTVIHMTATPRKLFRHYEYDSEYEFKCIIDDSNMKNLHINRCDNMNAAILNRVKFANADNKTAIVLINDKEKIKYYAEYYKRLGFVVGVLTGDEEHKESELFKYIVEKESIPQGFDIILTTTVVEVGTNIKKYDIVPIYAVCNANYFDIDSVIQFFARFRRDSINNIILDNAYLLVPNNNVNQVIKSIDALEEEILPSLKEDLRFLEKLGLDLFSKFSKENVGRILKDIVSVEQAEGGRLGQGIIEINEEDASVSISQKALTNRLYRDYDKQLLYNNLESLKHILKDYVKFKNIYISDAEEVDKTEVKNLKEVQNEISEDTKQQAKEIINKLHALAPHELELLVHNQSLENIKFSDEFKKDITFIRQEKTQLRLLRRAVKLELDLDISVNIVTKNDTDTNIDDRLRAFAYVKFNNSIDLNYYSTLKKLPRDEYGIIRLHLDPLAASSKRISNDVYIELLNDFYRIKKFKKAYDSCEKLLKLQSKKKKSSLSSQDKKDFDKFKLDYNTFKATILLEINKIYILNEDKSRIKKLKFELNETELYNSNIETNPYFN